MKGLGSGIKEFKNAAKDDQPADKKKKKRNKNFHKKFLIVKFQIPIFIYGVWNFLF